MLRRRAVVNAGLTLNFTDEKEKDPATGKPWHESWCYQNGIADYVACLLYTSASNAMASL